MSMNTALWRKLQSAFDEVPSKKGLTYREHAVGTLLKAGTIGLYTAGMVVHALFPMIGGDFEARIEWAVREKTTAAPWATPRDTTAQDEEINDNNSEAADNNQINDNLRDQVINDEPINNIVGENEVFENDITNNLAHQSDESDQE